MAIIKQFVLIDLFGFTFSTCLQSIILVFFLGLNYQVSFRKIPGPRVMEDCVFNNKYRKLIKPSNIQDLPKKIVFLAALEEILEITIRSGDGNIFFFFV